MTSNIETPQVAPKSPSSQSRVQFIVGDTDALSLRVFEVLFTCSFLLWITRCFISWQEWLTDSGFHLTSAELTAMGYPEPFASFSELGAIWLAVIIVIAALAHILNRCRRLALLGLFVAAVYTQGVDLIAAFTLNKIYVGIFGVLLAAPGYTKDSETGRLNVPVFVIRIIQMTLVLQYFAAGLTKMFQGDWLNYSDVLYTQVQGVYRTDFAACCLRSFPVWIWTVIQWTVLLFELEAPVLFFVSKLRVIVFVVGIGFHLMIAVLMKDLIFFSAQMWTFYALFVTAEQWRCVGAWLRRLLKSAKKPLSV